MFEKEAKEYRTHFENELYLFDNTDIFPNDIEETYQKGAEFGYNKANEWRYMKDVSCYEDLHFPPEEEEKGRVLIWKVQTKKGIKRSVCYHCGSYGDLWYEINAYHVIAWKEIVLPELKESEA